MTMKKALFCLGSALALSSCTDHVAVMHDVQEGHGGDGLAAQFVNSARWASINLRMTWHPNDQNYVLDRLDYAIQHTAVHSVENFKNYPGQDIANGGTISVRLSRSLRSDEQVLLLDRTSMRNASSGDDSSAIRNMAGTALRSYLAIDTEDAKRLSALNLDLPLVPRSFTITRSQSWQQIGGVILGQFSDSRLVVCSGFTWLKKLFDTVPVEPTDAALVDQDSGYEVDSIVSQDKPGDASTWRIRYNRTRVAALPSRMPLALLVLHEYLRASEVRRIDHDQYYKLSSDLAHEATWQIPSANAAVLGNAISICDAHNKLCRELINTFAIPE